jgi:hypothetical protein
MPSVRNDNRAAAEDLGSGPHHVCLNVVAAIVTGPRKSSGRPAPLSAQYVLYFVPASSTSASVVLALMEPVAAV